jgi:hypothetical protein
LAAGADNLSGKPENFAAGREKGLRFKDLPGSDGAEPDFSAGITLLV